MNIILKIKLLIIFIGVYSYNANAIYEDNITYTSQGVIDHNKSYLYAPSTMFDERDGKYKFWACGGVAGDHIVYKEAVKLEDLHKSPWHSALSPKHNNKFDSDHTCDPSVIRVGDIMYLYYSGLDENESNSRTRVGVAVSHDGGKNFTRVNNGNHIIEPSMPFEGGYGTGQQTVTYNPNDDYFYMAYTNLNGTHRSIDVVRSTNPKFPINSIEFVTSLNPNIVGSWSVDLVFNKSRNEFIIVGNNSSDNKDLVRVKISHYDQSFTYLGNTVFENPTGGFRFGEGVSLVTNSKGNISDFFEEGKHNLIFIASTHKDNNCTETCWVRGPVMYAKFSEGDHGVVYDYRINGWDIGIYNQDNNGKFNTHHGASDGIFSDESNWSWSNYPNAKVLTGDFNGDRLTDIGLYNPNNRGNIYIKYGDGQGGFNSQSAWHWGKFPNAQLITGDYDGDGLWDVGLYNPGGKGIFYIKYGIGNGSFGRDTAWRWGNFPAAKAVSGDFDGDGLWDIGLYNPLNKGLIFIKYGVGSGAFNRQTASKWGHFPNAQPFSGDFNNDGKWDFGLYNELPNGVARYRLGNGAGAFHEERKLRMPSNGTVYTGKFRN